MSSESRSATHGAFAVDATGSAARGAGGGAGRGGNSPVGVTSGLLIRSPLSHASTCRARVGFRCFGSGLLADALRLLVLTALEEPAVVVDAVVDAIEPAFEGGADDDPQQAEVLD